MKIISIRKHGKRGGNGISDDGGGQGGDGGGQGGWVAWDGAFLIRSGF